MTNWLVQCSTLDAVQFFGLGAAFGIQCLGAVLGMLCMGCFAWGVVLGM